MIFVLIGNTCVQLETQRYSNESQNILINATFHPEMFNEATTQVNHIYCINKEYEKTRKNISYCVYVNWYLSKYKILQGFKI